jgi:serine phosphatase RsbU (regulator of sigma subunit)
VAPVDVPEVRLPTLPGAPSPISDAVGGVNDAVDGTVGGVEDTLNGTVDGVEDTVNGTAGGVDDTVDDTVDEVTRQAPGVGSPSGGSNGAQPAGGGQGGGGSVGPPGGGGADQPTATGGGRDGSGGSTGRRARDRDGRAGARGEGRDGDARGAGARGSERTRAGADRVTGGGVVPAADESSNPVAQVIERIQEVIPGPVKLLIAVLTLIAVGFAVHSRFVAARARRLDRQRKQLLGDVGLLQRALLAEVPATLRGLDVSVAYRPADDGPAAGGDFYDVFELDGGRTAIIVGDVCGHGRAALAVTALMRYSLRAYLGAGFEPRVALQVAGRALQNDPESALTTVVLAVYDPSNGSLTYACAGHEAPIVLGPGAYEPITTLSSPPVGGFMATGQRQTTITLTPGETVCFFTDGLVEARLGDGLIGRERLTEMLDGMEEWGAQPLLEGVAAAADRAPDDMAACLVRPTADTPTGDELRVEELEADLADLDGPRVEEFLEECGVDAEAIVGALRAARAKAAEFGGAVLRVVVDGSSRRVEVTPRPEATLQVPSLEGPRERAASAVAV